MASARASSTILRSIRLRLDTGAVALVAEPDEIEDLAAPRARPLRRGSEPVRAIDRPTRTFSRAVMLANGRPLWNVRAIPARHMRDGVSPCNSRPPKRILPEDGRYTPVIRLNSVVLPAPFGPITPTILPGSTVNVTLCSACTPPKLTPKVLHLEQRMPASSAHVDLRPSAAGAAGPVTIGSATDIERPG